MIVEQATSLNPPAHGDPRGQGELAACAPVPWSFRLAKLLVRLHVRGGYRLLDNIRRRGWLDRVVRYSLSEHVSIDVPLFREDNCWDYHEIAAYESDLMKMLDGIVSKLTGPVRLIDGGADIGLFSLKLIARHTNITSIDALEPNRVAYEWLYRNLGVLPVESHPMCAALGEFAAHGQLENPEYDPSDHGKFVSLSDSGTIPITRIDDLRAVDPNSNLLLKLDIEGGELAALRGAQAAISRARQVVVAIEAHPRVAQRTGIDPIECLRFLNSIRPFEFRVAERPDVCISLDRNLFVQLSPQRNYNLVAVSARTQGGGS